MSWFKDIKKTGITFGMEYIRHVVFLYAKCVYYDKCREILEEYKFFYNEKYSVHDSIIIRTIEKNTAEASALLPGILYEKLLTTKEKKKLGQIYTPETTVAEMTEKVITDDEYLKNPYMKILDPACGAGYFLMGMFLHLKNIIENNIDYFMKKYYISRSEINSHIVKNNLYGYDIDIFSVFLAKINIRIICGENDNSTEFNISKNDFLLKEVHERYDIIIGNPPYIGYKNLDASYKKKLYDNYSVYIDKSDISYCFFEKAYSVLNLQGKLFFINSRYMLESKNAEKLRKFLTENFTIKYIRDYSGINLFSGTGVSPLLILLEKSSDSADAEFIYENIPDRDVFAYPQKKLDGSWRILNPELEKIINKIYDSSIYYIKDIANIYQGIISGLDKAFVLNRIETEEKNIEKKVIRKWIKGSSISRGNIEYSDLCLLYTNGYSEDQIPGTLEHLAGYKNRLSSRRECKTGNRKWYELQWGRKEEFFLEEKIIFPYKSSENNFYLDKEGYFFSADVYLLKKINEDASYKSIINYLNSSLFEFILKCTSKKIGVDLYEYYPYNIKELPYFEICENKNMNFGEIDEMLFNNAGLTKKEKEIVYNHISREYVK